jgi:hypothetical protein
MSVNYIKHLENFFAKISLDDRLSTVHLGLYYSLFHQWNLAKFQNTISINRSELMLTSKIGSANTYTRCLRELNDWGYIDYKPSNNPCRGSLVNMYRFDTSTDNSCDKGNNTTPVIAVRPSINNININKQLNNTNIGSDNLKVVTQSKSKKEIFIPPSFDAVVLFFKEKNKTDLEAQKFFNHFESNGWLVGGKAKMKNWHAAARNWILNSDKFQSFFWVFCLQAPPPPRFT